MSAPARPPEPVPPAPPPGPDEPAARFTALFEATHRPLLAYAVRRVADPSDAADVVAEAFLVAWRRIEDVPAGADARPWMFGVARRVLANFHRGTRRRFALADRLRAEVVEATPAPAPGDHDVSDVEQALSRLGDDDQELLRLVAWEELARDEIALVLGVSRAAVRVRLHRARRRLAAQLAALAAADDVPRVPQVQRAAPTGQVISGWAPARPGTEEA